MYRNFNNTKYNDCIFIGFYLIWFLFIPYLLKNRTQSPGLFTNLKLIPFLTKIFTEVNLRRYFILYK